MSEIRVDILIVDDNAQDAELVARALRRYTPDVNLRLSRDGGEAIEFLTDLSADEAPRLIILDLKMPKVDGFQFLRFRTGNAIARAIPVVVLSSSDLDRDVQLAYSLGVNSYVIKPIEFDDLTKAVGLLGEYWLRINHGSPIDVT